MVPGTNWERFQTKARAYLRDHEDHLALQRLRRNQPLTAADLAGRELARLVDGVAAFDDEARPYVSWAAPQFMGNFGGNYDHLARVWEWHVVGGEDEGVVEGEPGGRGISQSRSINFRS